ncbi:bifunctional nicotinamidase/pyrazinamidase [Leadbettera azotonutricia]|uniref:Nicotinamidase n=1 Tax=Leadbettera azotonutricia (strain ATCC BAA-888 / DSM 13862 / ZAS-9) TaxID=545695 RepID=F5Y8Z9_LEAAZ|nr:bifunctional nicotinamidase/pyrazinamidase [Leadbettera azotonutricia]AEF82157.1 pyrazinamidase/nicotinamidase (PZAase)(Nicotine deamidase) (NAMase) [Leadbettera azotonutricia ZAS-9]
MNIDFSASVLIEIDVQNDFCPGGALAVAQGNEVVKPLNNLAGLFASHSGHVVATQDWHPENHVSFAASHTGKKPGDSIDLPETKGQLLWPAHCVQGSAGACFHKELDLSPVSLILRKGFRESLDSYSAFFENDQETSTGLEGFLKNLGIKTVVIGGLATDYCVLYSALDAARLNFHTIVLRDAVRGVGYPEGSIEGAFKSLEAADVLIFDSKEIL